MFFFVVALYAEYRMVEEDSVFKCAIEPQQYESFYSFCKSSEGTGSVAGWFCKTQFVGKAFVYFPIECNFLKKQ